MFLYLLTYDHTHIFELIPIGVFLDVHVCFIYKSLKTLGQCFKSFYPTGGQGEFHQLAGVLPRRYGASERVNHGFLLGFVGTCTSKNYYGYPKDHGFQTCISGF